MAAESVRVLPVAASVIGLGGQSVIAVFGETKGGKIVNPSTATDQGIATVEPLYYSYVGEALSFEGGSTFALQPGQALDLPADMDSPLWVNAATTGHKFSGYVVQPASVFADLAGTFPPAVNPALGDLIPSYLYEQFQDDGNLQAFVRSYNALAQEYISWMYGTPLAIYTDDDIATSLLDWVALGIYGIARPTLSSGNALFVGSYATTVYANLAYAEFDQTSPSDVTIVTDDIFKRIMTWRLYRGDGKIFTANWLKKRIMRFLTYPNGTSGNIDNTYDVSVSFEAGNVVRIELPALPFSATLKEAIESGVCELPFQYFYIVTIAS